MLEFCEGKVDDKQEGIPIKCGQEHAGSTPLSESLAKGICDRDDECADEGRLGIKFRRDL